MDTLAIRMVSDHVLTFIFLWLICPFLFFPLFFFPFLPSVASPSEGSLLLLSLAHSWWLTRIRKHGERCHPQVRGSVHQFLFLSCSAFILFPHEPLLPLSSLIDFLFFSLWFVYSNTERGVIRRWSQLCIFFLCLSARPSFSSLKYFSIFFCCFPCVWERCRIQFILCLSISSSSSSFFHFISFSLQRWGQLCIFLSVCPHHPCPSLVCHHHSLLLVISLELSLRTLHFFLFLFVRSIRVFLCLSSSFLYPSSHFLSPSASLFLLSFFSLFSSFHLPRSFLFFLLSAFFVLSVCCCFPFFSFWVRSSRGRFFSLSFYLFSFPPSSFAIFSVSLARFGVVGPFACTVGEKGDQNECCFLSLSFCFSLFCFSFSLWILLNPPESSTISPFCLSLYFFLSRSVVWVIAGTGRSSRPWCHPSSNPNRKVQERRKKLVNTRHHHWDQDGHAVYRVRSHSPQGLRK